MRNLVSPVLKDNLIRLALAYLKATKETNPHMSLERISRMAHGDPPFFDKLIAGKCSVTLRKYDEAIAWFDDYAQWPEGCVVPELNDTMHGERRVNPDVPPPQPRKVRVAKPKTARKRKAVPAKKSKPKTKKAKTDGKKGRDGSKGTRKKAVPVGDCG